MGNISLSLHFGYASSCWYSWPVFPFCWYPFPILLVLAGSSIAHTFFHQGSFSNYPALLSSRGLNHFAPCYITVSLVHIEPTESYFSLDKSAFYKSCTSRQTRLPIGALIKPQLFYLSTWCFSSSWQIDQTLTIVETNYNPVSIMETQLLCFSQGKIPPF